MVKGRRVFYTMGQICEMFDLPASTIRYWEKRFHILAPRKNAKGNRLFTPADLENLKLIYHLTKERRMTLSGAESYLLQRKVAAKSELSQVEILQRIRATLVEIVQEIDTIEAQNQASAGDKNLFTEVVVVGERIDDDEALAAHAEIEDLQLKMF